MNTKFPKVFYNKHLRLLMVLAIGLLTFNAKSQCTVEITASAINATSSTTADGSIDVTFIGPSWCASQYSLKDHSTGIVTPGTAGWLGGQTVNICCLSPGTYTVYSTDCQGCLDSSIVTVGFNTWSPVHHAINTDSNTFDPDTAIVTVGDYVNFNLGPYHNAVEVSQSTWQVNGTTSNGGFNFPYGSTSSFVPTVAQTYYYVCQSHVAMGMKGVIIANPLPTAPCAVEVTASAVNASDSTTNDGSIDATFIGPTWCAVQYSLKYHSNGSILTSYPGSNGGETVTFCCLPPGTYTVYSTDCQGCEDSVTVTVGIAPCSSYGCTDPTAYNYNYNACIDDGSCSSLCGDLNGDGSINILDVSYYINMISAAQYSLSADVNCDGVVDQVDQNLLVNYVMGSGSLNCCVIILGCTDSTATNYNPNANIDDGSCVYTSLVYGCTDPLAFNYNPAATVDDGSCTYCIYGCTNQLAINYNPAATCDDGSCTYTTACGAITGVNLTDVIHDRATFNWDDMNTSTCVVDQIRIRYREVGTSAYSTKTMGPPVGNNAPCLNTSKRVLNLSASTQHEYDFKIWYQDGTVVTWHANGTFTTQPQCDNVTNVTATPITTTKTEFCWTPPGSSYAFVRLKYRENIPGSSFSNIGGMGVLFPTLCKEKNGIIPGLQYRVMWRTWCSPTGGPYRSSQWDGPVLWTQPTSIRVEGGAAINNLEIYPNPSRDIFNVSFNSETKQTIEVRITNLVGEIIYIENLEDFEGEYIHSFNLKEYSKGVYLLELDTDNGIVNKKLILQ